MHLHNRNLAYFADTGQKNSKTDSIHDELNRILDVLAKYTIKDRPPRVEDLESLIQESLDPKHIPDMQEPDTEAITKRLLDLGYIRDHKKWLTNKGFFQIGNNILYDIMRNLDSSDLGLHETDRPGSGSIVSDSTKKFEPGNDIKHLSAQHTILNSIMRLARENRSTLPPIHVETEDLEEFETQQDVRAAVVYCIDLSSTMRIRLGNTNRIEAAKRALWALYMLNRRFFPNDSVSVVGFASLASQVSPFDIPFLKTYDANDSFLHYTNYQAALRTSRRILEADPAENKRIVLITDGQPSACFVENAYQKTDIISEKPYSSFYTPEKSMISKIMRERGLKLDANYDRLVYLCYRHKKVDPKIDKRTAVEARRCTKSGISVDSIVVGDEEELLDYVRGFEKMLRGKTYHIQDEGMDRVIVTDYVTNSRKVFSKKRAW